MYSHVHNKRAKTRVCLVNTALEVTNGRAVRCRHPEPDIPTRSPTRSSRPLRRPERRAPVHGTTERNGRRPLRVRLRNDSSSLTVRIGSSEWRVTLIPARVSLRVAVRRIGFAPAVGVRIARFGGRTFADLRSS